jgi:hypothetical protein
VDGLVTTDEEFRKLMLVVAANKEVDSSKREDIEIRRYKTRICAIVVYLV